MMACWHELGLWVGDRCRSHPGKFKAQGTDDLLNREKKASGCGQAVWKGDPHLTKWPAYSEPASPVA